MSSTTTDFRPLINPNSKTKPMKQIFAGFEIEKRQVLLTKEKDHTKKGNGLEFYNEVLEDGVLIEQGYIKDISKVLPILKQLGVELNDFKPNTIRLRKFGEGHRDKKISKYPYVLTLKDRKETKKREVEFRLKESHFNKWWPLTEGARVYKKRLKKKIKGYTFELDAFVDRILFIAECEVDKEEEMEGVPKIGMDVTNQKNWSNKCLSK
jgi:CYTH domain-containing protein